MAGDGIVDSEWFKEAGSAADGVYATIAAPDPSKLESAQKFVADYRAANNEGPGPYSANSYDAANIIIEAAYEAIAANGGTLPTPAPAFREAVRSRVAQISFSGSIGHTSFDRNGDTTNVLLTLEQSHDGAWTYNSTLFATLPGSTANEATAAAGTPLPHPTLSGCLGTITVGSDLPTSGTDASDGLPTQRGVQLAIDQANASHTFGGCRVVYAPRDDASPTTGKHDAAVGVTNVSALAADPTVIGVVGPFNSAVAIAELPVANRADLTMISPSNTAPGLTIAGSDPTIDTATLRPTGRVTYFRVCTTDIGQGLGLANAAYHTLGSRRAYVFDDKEAYGQALASQFSNFFGSEGGTVVGRASLPATTRDFSAQLAEARQAGADLIFFGGDGNNGGALLRKQMVDQGMVSPKP